MSTERTYSISEVAKIMGVAPSAIRYYDKEGLLPFVERVNGIRVFKDKDFGSLRILECLKSTGMPISEIRKYFELCKLGDDSLKERREIILKQKEALKDQMNKLQEEMKELEYKEWYYNTAIEAGTERIHEGRGCNPTMKPDEIPDEMN